MKTQIHELKDEMANYGNKIDENERGHQLNTIIIDGMYPNFDLPIKTDVTQRLRKITEINFSEFDIAKAFVHATEDGHKPRPIQIRFKDIDLKRDIMKRKGMFKPTQLFVKEYLTAKQGVIFYQSKQAKKSGMIDDTWTISGLVYGASEPNGQGQRIYDLELIKQANEKYKPTNKRNDESRNGRDDHRTGQVRMETDAHKQGQQSYDPGTGQYDDYHPENTRPAGRGQGRGTPYTVQNERRQEQPIQTRMWDYSEEYPPIPNSRPWNQQAGEEDQIWQIKQEGKEDIRTNGAVEENIVAAAVHIRIKTAIGRKTIKREVMPQQVII